MPEVEDFSVAAANSTTTTTHNYKCGARAVNFRALTADRALLQSFAVLHTENVLVKLYPSVIGGD